MGILDALLAGTLHVGSSGEEVKKLQTALNQKLGKQLNVDGYFGPATAAAVIEFQKANGLTPDSVVGKKTKAKLGI